MRSTLCKRIALISIILWLIILIVICTVKFPTNSEELGLNKRIQRVLEKVDALERQNANLKVLFDEIKIAYESQGGPNLDSILEKAQALGINTKSVANTPHKDYEQLRRLISNNINELWFFLSNEFKLLEKETKNGVQNTLDAITHLNKMALQYKMSLIKDSNRLSEVDGYEAWRQAEAESLGSLVQRRLTFLQNPKTCSSAKKILCNLNKGCGYGCQLHHAAYCLIVAYATQRTLILKSKGWRYHKNGWEDIFQPLSDTCVSPVGESTALWPGKSDTQVINLPIIDTLSPRPDFLPPSIPEDLAPRLIRLHGQPIVWWIGQMLRFLLRPQKATNIFFQNAKEALSYKKPIVGVHIRRTDKVGTEAAYHRLEEYMDKVNAWYDEQEYNGVKIDKKRIYLATDEPKVITEAKEKYSEYEILADVGVAKTAGMSTRYTNNSLYGIMLDIHLLSLSDHLVCTFSSQVCRVAFELMQTYNAQASNSFTSLDDVYYYGGQNAQSAVAVIAHEAMRTGEMDLQVGDQIAVAGNHWDGYSKGRNLRTNIIGLYPSFKVHDRVKTANFPTYDQVPTET